MGPTSWGGPLRWSLLLLLAGLISGLVRVKRETGTTSQSLLTVEWEGIQTGDHPDSDVQGFLVEYRAENDLDRWNVHSGIIPYKGPNHQYRVQIPRLPMGISFFVRIKVLGTDGSVLVETPEIRARNEMVSIKCDIDDVSEPRNVEITQASRFSLAFRWDVPECGSIGDYQVEVAGLGNASFDIHRQTVIQPSASITNLLPGSVYAIKVRASDRSRNTGPWSSEILEAQTKGDAISSSNAIHVDYRTDVQIRITWLHYDDERLQHYEVMAVEQDADSRRVERARVSPQQSSHVLSGLKPNTRYLIGVVAFVDHEPKQSYSITAQTAQEGAAVWANKPQVVEEADGVATVHWTVPPVTATPVTRFIVEYRLPSENQWQRGDERAFDGSVGDYSVSLSDLVDVPFYAVRIVAVDDSNQAVAVTDELTVGHAAEGACIGRAGVPRNVRVVAVGGEAAKFEWDKPSCDESVAPIDGYEYLIWESSQAAPPDGASYVGASTIVADTLQPSTKYSFKVRSRSGNGHSAWSSPIETTTAASGPLQAGHSSTSGDSVQIEQPRIEQQGSRSTVYWTVVGQTANIASYQPEIRTHSEQWKAVGGAVDNDKSQRHFRQQLGGLSASLYYVRVRAIDSNGRTVATSPSTSFQVQCQAPLVPENVRLDRVSENLVRISWNAPQEDQSCGGVFYITGVVDGQQVNYRVASTERHFDIQANPSSINLEIRASNKAGSGTASQQAVLSNARQSSEVGHRLKRSICDPSRDFWCSGFEATHAGRQSGQALVSTPRVSTRGNDLHVTWRSEGEGRGVFGYRVQFRTDQSGWNPYGQIVPYTGDNQEYQQTLTGLQLGHTYYIHIQVLDRNSYVMYTSAESSATSECKAPSHPPSHLAVSAPDASHVRVSWAHPPQSTWGCADLQFEIQAEEPYGQAPVSVAGGQTTHIFQSRPNEKWAVKIRARNSAGHSAWTPISSVRTPAAGELIIGPNVQYRQGSPILSWQSKEGVDSSTVASYSVEWKNDRDENWRQHSNQIPFSGNQRGYQVDLSGLPKGQTYQCRVVAKGPRGEIAFTSPAVAVQTSQACQKPRRAPSGLQVQPVGPTQIKLTWTPLPESEWNCDRVWYIVKYSTPRNQGFKNLTQGENSVLFESDPYTQWRFEVQAANPAGESEWSRTEVAQTQAAAPGPVADLRIQPLGPDSVQVSWRPPANPNGQITSYEITYQLTNRGMCEEVREAPRTEQSQQPYFVLRNLHPHSKYRIGVAARTTIAGERVSQEVSTDQSTPTAAPNYLRVEDSRQDSASISWQAPTCLQTNGDITEYEYEVTPADRRTHVQKTTNNVRGTRAQITNLQPNTRYNAKVRAYTARGAGPWSQEVAFQTAGHSIVQAPPHISVIDAGADNAHILWQSSQSPTLR